jgi:SNF2 family DNA or RNA helicase
VDGLQHVCSYIVFAEVCPFPGTFEQAIGRLHRTGQREATINVYLLVAKGTIAVKLRNNLVNKDKDQESVVKDKRKILADLMGEDGIYGSFDLN